MWMTFEDGDALGTVISVDTAIAIVKVADIRKLRQLHVSQLVMLESSRAGRLLVGMVHRVTRRAEGEEAYPSPGIDEIAGDIPIETSLVRVGLIGTFFLQLGGTPNVFRRSLVH